MFHLQAIKEENPNHINTYSFSNTNYQLLQERINETANKAHLTICHLAE